MVNTQRVREDVRKFFDAAETLGFSSPELLRSGHWRVYSDNGAGDPVTYCSTSSDWRALRNAVSELERVSGRKLERQTGYRGGSAELRRQTAQRQRWNVPASLRYRTKSEQFVRTASEDMIQRIDVVDGCIAEAVGRDDREAVERLLDTRSRMAEFMESEWRILAPTLSVGGVEAVLADETSTVTIEDLREKFGRR